MPVMPPTFRPRTGRGSAPDAVAAERAYDRRRAAESETRKLYKTARWRRLREAQLSASPVCTLCEGAGRTTTATVCDHVRPHGGDVALFWSGPFQSLCAPCHNTVKQREEAAARRQG